MIRYFLIFFVFVAILSPAMAFRLGDFCSPNGNSYVRVNTNLPVFVEISEIGPSSSSERFFNFGYFEGFIDFYSMGFNPDSNMAVILTDWDLRDIGTKDYATKPIGIEDSLKSVRSQKNEPTKTTPGTAIFEWMNLAYKDYGGAYDYGPPIYEGYADPNEPYWEEHTTYGDVIVQIGSPLPAGFITFGISGLLAGAYSFRKKRQRV